MPTSIPRSTVHRLTSAPPLLEPSCPRNPISSPCSGHAAIDTSLAIYTPTDSHGTDVPSSGHPSVTQHSHPAPGPIPGPVCLSDLPLLTLVWAQVLSWSCHPGWGWQGTKHHIATRAHKY